MAFHFCAVSFLLFQNNSDPDVTRYAQQNLFITFIGNTKFYYPIVSDKKREFTQFLIAHNQH